MEGFRVSQLRAEEAGAAGCLVWLSQTTGFWLQAAAWTRWYRTGDQMERIPEDAFRWSTTITLAEAAPLFGLSYSTLAQAARERRIEAWRSGATWLTTRKAVSEAIRIGALRPRHKP